MSSKAEAQANSERTTMTHVTIERARLVQILEALNSPAYGKELRELQDKAIATCQQALAQPAPVQPVTQWRNAAIAAYPNSDPDQWPDSFKVRFMEQEIAQLRATPPAAPVPLTDLGTLQAIVDEYYAWIRHHAAGHDYDDFLRNRIAHGITKGQR